MTFVEINNDGWGRFKEKNRGLDGLEDWRDSVLRRFAPRIVRTNSSNFVPTYQDSFSESLTKDLRFKGSVKYLV